VFLSSQLSAQDFAQFFGIDVTARHDARDLASACLAGQSTCNRASACAFGDNAVALSEQTDSRRHFREAGHDSAIEQLSGAVEHLGQDRLAADTVYK
jgi:hypothetical protein